MEFIVAEVERSVDGLERLEVNINLSFLAFGSQDFSAVDHQAICGYFVVQLQALLS